MRSRKLFVLSLLTLGLILTVVFYQSNARVKTVSQPEGMVLIPGGSFAMGAEDTYPDALPIHQVMLRPYYIDEHEVTNEQFAAFVSATEHRTQAEKDGYAWCYLEGGTDFEAVTGADWQHPLGPESSISNMMNHPVTCVSWEDAAAYAAWAGKRLPTEAEWEFAARAGSETHVEAQNYEDASSHGYQSDGHGLHAISTNDKSPSSKSHAGSEVSTQSLHRPEKVEFIAANVWEGHWPDNNRKEDGYYYTAPSATYPANSFGLHDMIGNVWEWTADWYASDYYAHSDEKNPTGPLAGEYRVARGGSWFCSPNYCGAYSSHYRGASPPSHTFANVGFRCALDAPEN